ncbi:flagellar hook-length control protein FliK [Idiomarina xiamenensis]|uniref:Flagellar hook-length control protein n=1 Tax=Idiomarina xiamenensis 10-D-4 TaxID=740709 RepID=K2KCL7_9GAMM|nr:flagellar hook-length control protein FliK [Idiomarina xiamenensis]EKE80514.1 flagellar hook-length control protein [Idiomarina xiamenensis 10-D-4]
MPQPVMPQPARTANNSTSSPLGLSSNERTSSERTEQFASTLEQQAQQHQQQVYAEQRRNQQLRAQQADAEQRQARTSEQQAAERRADAHAKPEHDSNKPSDSSAKPATETNKSSSTDNAQEAESTATQRDDANAQQDTIKNAAEQGDEALEQAATDNATDSATEQSSAATDEAAQQWLALLEAMREQLNPEVERDGDGLLAVGDKGLEQRLEQFLAQLDPAIRDAARQLIAANHDNQSLQQLAALSQQLLQIAEQQPEADVEQWLASLKQQLQSAEGGELTASQQRQLQQLGDWLTQQTDGVMDKTARLADNHSAADKPVALLRALVQLQQASQQTSQQPMPQTPVSASTSENNDKALMASQAESHRQSSANNARSELVGNTDKSIAMNGQQDSQRDLKANTDGAAARNQQQSEATPDNRQQASVSGREAMLQQVIAQTGQSDKQSDKASVDSTSSSLNTSAALMSAARENNSLAQQQQQRVADASTSFAQALRQSQQSLDGNDPQAALQLRERVLMMVNQGVQRADIRLDPPELGGLHIRLHVQNDQASVHFQVQHQQSREIVEQALPRLKEMLEQQGLQLADSNVSEQRQQGNDSDAQPQSTAAAAQGELSATEGELTQVMINDGQPLGVGRVDFYI